MPDSAQSQTPDPGESAAGEQLPLLELTESAAGTSGQGGAEQHGALSRSGRAADPRGGGHDHTPAYLSEELPVARVILESHVPHLDRVFDYGVPRDLAEQAVPGTRVRVRFGGQQMMGWVIQRVQDSEIARDRLQPLQRVVSACPVLTETTLAVARLVAERYAGTLSDVLRAAVPPRVAAVEKRAAQALSAVLDDAEHTVVDQAAPLATQVEDVPEPEPSQGPEPEPEPSPKGAPAQPAAIVVDDSAEQTWRLYQNGPQVWEQLSQSQPHGTVPRAVIQALPSHRQHTALDLVAQAVAATVAQGRGAVVVVPDAKTLERLQTAVEARVTPEVVARLHSEDKPTPRYRAFMDVLHGRRQVVLGTRPAVWAPVHNPGLVVVVNDGDANLVEQRAPYHHARDVALLRSEHEGLALLIVSHGVTPEAQRLVDTGWATQVRPEREVLRRNMPRIVATADSWHAEHDSLAGRARLPETAYRVAREALQHGPVLVQVARAGYAPTIACDRCREPARCTVCDGPLRIGGHGQIPVCGWCAREALAWSCGVCGASRWRMTSVGSQRTAEELGRAFPQVPVIASSGDSIRRTVTDQPALIVATPGAEPWADGGYAAALLLDGDRMLSRPGLRAEDQTLSRWFEASALVRAGSQNGTVVITSEHTRAVNTLVRWDPSGHAVRELAERRALHLPPAVRSAAVTGPLEALEDFLGLAGITEEDPSVRLIGPAPVPSHGQPAEDGNHRVLLFFAYAAARDITRRLRAARKEASALRRSAPVQVRCDIADLL